MPAVTAPPPRIDRADGREEHDRLPEGHRDDVDDEAHPDVRRPAQVAPARRRPSAGRRRRCGPPSGRMRGSVHSPKKPAKKSIDVDGVGPRRSRPAATSTPAIAGPTVTMMPIEMPSQRGGLGQLLPRQQARVIACRVAEAMVAATALTVVMT